MKKNRRKHFWHIIHTSDLFYNEAKLVSFLKNYNNYSSFKEQKKYLLVFTYCIVKQFTSSGIRHRDADMLI